MQPTEMKVVERSDLKKRIVAALSAGRFSLVAGILAMLIAGAYGAHMAEEVLQARALMKSAAADEGLPHNLITALKADEGVPHHLVTAMKADEGVPHNLVATLPVDEGTPFRLRLALQADEGVPLDLLTA